MWFIKEREEKPSEPAQPVTVYAPIVTDARRADGAKPLLDFIKNLEGHSNTEIAAAEGERLIPYFNALSGVIMKALETTSNDAETQIVKDSAAPGALRRMFNYIAERTHNTLTSDVSIVPMTVLNQGPASHYFQDQPQFNVPYDIGGLKFSFGFLQVFEGGSVKTARSSTSFPVFMIDERMTDAIKDHAPEKLLKGLQSSLTFINHDMLHHFTLPVINPAVAKKFDKDANGYGQKGYTLLSWLRKLPGTDNHHSLYEDWAQMSHEVTMQQPENAGPMAVFTKGIDNYFDELKRIGADIAKSGSVQDAHAVVDFYGTLMAHTLCRVFPLDHPVMAHALDRLHDADPQPSTPAGVAGDMITLDKDVAGKAFPGKSALQQVRMLFSVNPNYKSAIETYRAQGLELLPDDENSLTWRGMKQLQLMRVSFDDVHPHMAKPVSQSMQELRGSIGDQMISMMSAATNTFRFPVRAMER